MQIETDRNGISSSRSENVTVDDVELSIKGVDLVYDGRGLHSSTTELNLSRFWHKHTP